MKKKGISNFSDFTNVKKTKEELIPEEFPEGAVGSPIGKEDPVFSKSTPWKKGQRRSSAYVYPDENQHEDIPRNSPGAHPLHDE